MPRYSAFTRYGLLRFSSAPSEAEKVYDAMVQSYTDPVTGRAALDLSHGTDLEARIYATSMAIGAAREAVKRAVAQQNPAASLDKLPDWEETFEVIPSRNDSIAERRAVLGTMAKLPRGARREAMEDGLRMILGDDFLAYRVLTTTEAETWPADPSTGPGVFSRVDLPPRRIRLTTPVTSATATVRYENWDTSQPEVLIGKGDVLCVQPENLGLAEKVTVTASEGVGDARTLTATFAHAHDVDASATTGPAPIWWSTKRYVLVVVKEAAALDMVTRRKVEAFMARAARTVTLWGIVSPATAGGSTIGPFKLGTSKLSVTTLGSLAVTP